jgi:hypothetical protein
MTGWRVARELRDRPENKHLKIVIVSANAHEYAPGGGSEDDLHDAFVMKPIDMHALLECMRSLMGLEWIHEAHIPSALHEDVNIGLPERSRHHLDDLYQLGRIGHVRGIHAKLREIEAEDPANSPFAHRLRTLVANFDLKRYMTVLEGMRDNG